MHKDIDLQELIKIVSEIQAKDRNKKVVYGQQPTIDINNVKQEFDSKAAIKEKIMVLKDFEHNYLFNNQDENRYLKLFFEESKLLEKIKITWDTMYIHQTKLKEINLLENFVGFNNISPIRIEKYIAYRSAIRDGIIPYYDEQFILIYIYELFLNIGVRDEYDGFDMLFFVLTYFTNDAPWVKDFAIRVSFEYIVLYQLDISKTGSNKAYQTYLLNNLVRNYNAIFYKQYHSKGYLDNINRIFDSYYYTYHRVNSLTVEVLNTLKALLAKVVQELDNYFDNLKNKNSKITLRDLLFTKCEKTIIKCIKTLKPLSAASGEIILFDDFILKYQFNEDLKKTNIIYQDYKVQASNEKIFKYLCSEIEYYYMDQKQLPKKVKRKLSPDVDVLINDKSLSDIITMVIKKVIGIKISEEFLIDYTKLDSIRKISNEVSEKLITEFDLDLEKEEPKLTYLINDNNNDWEKLESSLSGVDLELLNKIYQQEDLNKLNQFALSNNSLLEVMVEQINNLASELIGDNLIEFGDEIYIYDEHINEILKFKGWVKK